MHAKRVLLVNGDEHTRHANRVLLERGGFTVLEAGDVAAALVVVRQDPPDLIIQEIRFDGFDGLDMIRTIKATQATRHVLVLVISSQLLHEESAGRAGCDGFLPKPCLPSRMLEAAQQLLA